MNDSKPQIPVRREPPPFRRVTVRAVTPLSPRLARITLTGDELAGLEIDEPAASVRLLIPSPGTDELIIPTWRGNEFLLPDDRSPDAGREARCAERGWRGAAAGRVVDERGFDAEQDLGGRSRDDADVRPDRAARRGPGGWARPGDARDP